MPCHIYQLYNTRPSVSIYFSSENEIFPDLSTKSYEIEGLSTALYSASSPSTYSMFISVSPCGGAVCPARGTVFGIKHLRHIVCA